MWSAFAEVMPLAVALALSPFAVVTGVVLLLGERGRPRAALFGLGWFAGILGIASAAFWVVDAAHGADAQEADDAVEVGKIVLGGIFLALALLSWRKRPAAGERPREAKLLDRLSAMSGPAAFGLGLAQGVVVVKNVPLAVGAGVAIGDANATDGEALVLLVLFAVLATGGVIGPLLVSLAGGAWASAKLADLRIWLEANLTTITVAILVLLGVLFVIDGASG